MEWGSNHSLARTHSFPPCFPLPPASNGRSLLKIPSCDFSNFEELQCDQSWRGYNLFFKCFFLEFGMTLIWPTLGDLPRSNVFWEVVGTNLSKKFDIWRSPKIGQIRVIPNSRKKHLKNKLGPLHVNLACFNVTWLNYLAWLNFNTILFGNVYLIVTWLNWAALCKKVPNVLSRWRATHACPSFGMTTTQDIGDVFT